jgi:4-hydroxybenzoyl-CoA thioesterase
MKPRQVPGERAERGGRGERTERRAEPARIPALDRTPLVSREGPTFRQERLIRFSDCDPAGIVFYPQYFVMFNGLLEDWVGDGLGIGFRNLLTERRIGLPTVRLEADFTGVSRMGDRVVLTLDVERLGSRSITLALRCTGLDGVPRMSMRQVLVTTSLENHRAVEIPADLRVAIARDYPAIA